MGYRLREIEEEAKFCDDLTVSAINRMVPAVEIEAALEAENVKAGRIRKISLQIMVLVIIGINLYPYLSFGHVGYQRTCFYDRKLPQKRHPAT